MRVTFVLAGLALFAAAPAQAAAEPACPADAPVPAEFAGWRAATAITAASDVAGLPAARLAPGKAARLALRSGDAVRFAAPPGRAAAAGSHGGMAGFVIARAGRYRVALDGGAWVDLVRDGKAIASTGHGHGPACSGIRKIVDFTLRPGRHVLQISGSAAPQVVAMIVPAG